MLLLICPSHAPGECLIGLRCSEVLNICHSKTFKCLNLPKKKKKTVNLLKTDRKGNKVSTCNVLLGRKGTEYYFLFLLFYALESCKT